ncbi:MAG: hypothetical protein WBP93_09520 [Pyrinomonadaceae bacterium]
MAYMTIKSVGAFSIAKIQSAIMATLGLIFGILYGLFFMIFGGIMMSQSGAGGVSSIVIGLVMMVAIPIMYGIIGFIAGPISGLVYNLVAGFVGGIEIELEGQADTAYAPPPPPQQWTGNQYQAGNQPY